MIQIVENFNNLYLLPSVSLSYEKNYQTKKLHYMYLYVSFLKWSMSFCIIDKENIR